ncbi:MAG TPA: hypothetical protein EYG92_12390 [Lutibacter sp.]|nr:hypothetical protein [Lutibacter sp.]
MRKLLIVLITLISFSTLQAQSFTGQGDQKLQAGFTFYGYGTGIKATYDYGLNESFSIGVGANFFNSGIYSSGFFIFGRGDYHFQEIIDIPNELDVYIGAELGLIGKSNFGIGGHIGARYEFANNLSAFLEVGNNGAIGVTLSL